ncbi:MAG: hypothetical protein IJB81_05575 [Clostridia bacterium]|nr:hypothetical protein [Clostridia bacterium]
MTKVINEDTRAGTTPGTTVTDDDGTQYFMIRNYRIKISEHFASQGKPFDLLMEDVIHRAGMAT